MSDPAALAELGNPGDSLSATIIGVSAMFTVLTIMCLGLRLVSRKLTTAGWELDDYLAVCATICLIGIMVCVGFMANNGIGRHVTWLFEHLDSIERLGKTTLAFSYIYPTAQLFAKTSALVLIRRIFTLHDPFIRCGYWLLITYNVLVWIGGILMVSLQCSPFSSNWGYPTQCAYPPAASLTLNTLIASTDLFLILLPQPSIWRLKMDLGRRLGLSLVFMISLLAFCVSIVRIVFVWQFQSSADSSYHESIPVIFTVVEPSCFIICGCLPSIPQCLRPLRGWSGWSKLSSLVRSSRGGTTNASQLSASGKEFNPSGSIVATNSWRVLHSGDQETGSNQSREYYKQASTESTERLELGDMYGARTVYVAGGGPGGPRYQYGPGENGNGR